MEDCSSDGRFICLLNGFFDEEYKEYEVMEPAT